MKEEEEEEKTKKEKLVSNWNAFVLPTAQSHLSEQKGKKPTTVVYVTTSKSNLQTVPESDLQTVPQPDLQTIPKSGL